MIFIDIFILMLYKYWHYELILLFAQEDKGKFKYRESRGKHEVIENW